MYRDEDLRQMREEDFQRRIKNSPGNFFVTSDFSIASVYPVIGDALHVRNTGSRVRPLVTGDRLGGFLSKRKIKPRLKRKRRLSMWQIDPHMVVEFYHAYEKPPGDESSFPAEIQEAVDALVSQKMELCDGIAFIHQAAQSYVGKTGNPALSVRVTVSTTGESYSQFDVILRLVERSLCSCNACGTCKMKLEKMLGAWCVIKGGEKFFTFSMT